MPADTTADRRMRAILPFGARMTLGGVAALVHAFLPFCFVTTAGHIIDELVQMRSAQRERSVRVVDAATTQPFGHSV